MKIKKTTKKINKPVLIIAIVLLAGLLAFLAYTFIFKPHTNSSENTTQPASTSSDKQQSDTTQTGTGTKDTPPNSDAPAAPTNVSGSDKKQVSMVASVDQSNNTVFIRGGVNYPVTDGSCYAQLTGPSGQSVKKDSEILPNPASSDCKTISIPASELAPGKWTFTLNYTSDKYEGISSEVSFTL